MKLLQLQVGLPLLNVLVAIEKLGHWCCWIGANGYTSSLPFESQAIGATRWIEDLVELLPII